MLATSPFYVTWMMAWISLSFKGASETVEDGVVLMRASLAWPEVLNGAGSGRAVLFGL